MDCRFSTCVWSNCKIIIITIILLYHSHMYVMTKHVGWTLMTGVLQYMCAHLILRQNWFRMNLTVHGNQSELTQRPHMQPRLLYRIECSLIYVVFTFQKSIYMVSISAVSILFNKSGGTIRAIVVVWARPWNTRRQLRWVQVIHDKLVYPMPRLGGKRSHKL